MRTKEEIKQQIRSKVPLMFGKAPLVDPRDFLTRFKALIDYASAVSEPFLKPETIRYQSILLYVTLIFASLNLLSLDKVKIGETLVSVDRKLLVVYAIFMVLVCLIFLIKAYVDFERAQFGRSKNAEVSSELQQLIEIGVLKRQVQHYFWLEIFDIIGRSYQLYQDAVCKVVTDPWPWEHTPMNVLQLKFEELRKSPELSTELDFQEKHLTALKDELLQDEDRFRDKTEMIFNSTPAETRDAHLAVLLDTRYEQIKAVFDKTIGRWIEARNELVDENLSFQLKVMGNPPEIAQLHAMKRVFQRMLIIRRIYVALEIAAPLAFAVFTIVYVWLR